MNVIQEIEAERRRQVDKGFTPEHDDTHTNHQLLRAASAFMCSDIQYWPSDWDDSFDSTLATLGKNKRRDMIKGIALMVAEVERLDRADAWKKS